MLRLGTTALGQGESPGPANYRSPLPVKLKILTPPPQGHWLGKGPPEAQGRGSYQWGRSSWGPFRAEVRQEV